MTSFVSDQPLAPTASALRSGALDPAAYIAKLWDRIDVVDPEIHALLPEVGRRERLMHEASELVTRYPDPATRPPLFGIPVGVKDIFHVDGFATHAGSALPPTVLAGGQACVITQLRAAGALILGKTVTTEFAFFEPGPTRNPHNLEHTPGGSSSGSAAAVAAGLCPLALGTQTIGSTIRPAAFCGIVGFKPSYGRISMEGVIPCAPSLDHVGLFAQEVAGIALAAPALCRDWNMEEVQRPPVLGVPDGPYLGQASPEALAAFEGQIVRLQTAGFAIRRVPALADIEAINHRHRRLMFGEMARVHQTWFGEFRHLYRPATTEAIRTGQTISDDEMGEARAGQIALRESMQRLMHEAGIDLWLSPAATGAAPRGLAATGNPIMNLPWTHAGLPTINLPAGLAEDDLPLGLQCAADFMADEQLLSWAAEIEQVAM